MTGLSGDSGYELLRDPHELVPISAVPLGDPLPQTAQRPPVRQPCEPVREPLVKVSRVPLLDAYDVLGILSSRDLCLRTGIELRLLQALNALPAGFGLLVLDGWRSLAVQQQLLDYYGAVAGETGFVAEIDPVGARPPHTTGGAVDLTLTYWDVPLGLGSDYDAFDETATLGAFENEDGLVRRLRRLLANVMHSAGMICYDSEWWHWSYGDDFWAAAVNLPSCYEIYETESNGLAA